MSGERLLQVQAEVPAALAAEVHQSAIHGNEMSLAVSQDAFASLVVFLHQRFQATLVSLHAVDERPMDGVFRLYAVLSLPQEDYFISVSCAVDPMNPHFRSLTPGIPAANWYEREIQDMLGLVPEGHPDPRPLVLYDDWPAGSYPLRKDFPWDAKVPRVPNEYFFRRVEGEGVYEIPVGPIHAGVIEPGHFRFSVAGEPILNLEVRLGYTHRGIEKLSERTPYPQGIYLAERISGDNSVAHSTAYCQAVERAAEASIPERAEYIRTIYLEMERLYNHFGDIAGIALDTAFSVGASHGYILREKMLNLNECITGSRLLRSVNVLGGVRRDLTPNDREKITAALIKLKLEFSDLVSLMIASPSLLDRVETTGVLSAELARGLNVVGPGARASGIVRDVRRDHPYAAYGHLSFLVPHYTVGDVNARLHVKIDEVYESMSLIEQALDNMPSGERAVRVETPPEHCIAHSLVEAPRGELMHWMMTGVTSPYRHKIRDPSFCNWLALEYAVLGNIVPDFPLINKSFNLSYSGNDL